MDISKINLNQINSSASSAVNKAESKDFENRLESVMKSKDEKELKKVCKEFEGILLGIIYKQMKATVPKAGLIPDGIGRDIFEGMLDDKIIEEASKNRSYGLADDLYKQLWRQFSKNDP
ncbi:MAG: flagellar biosynthesis protein FlgJ [Clostridiaceae bacterium]|nr:flagellar biosynthesis protein FlgJ [Clostridiaceae bacterium]